MVILLRNSLLERLWGRYGGGAEFRELRKSAQALSFGYVEGRSGAGGLSTLSGRSKKLAFASFFSGLHLLAVSEVVARLHLESSEATRVLDLGCGTLMAGAAWAMAASGVTRVEGVDRNPWAVSEARWTLRELGLPGTVRRLDLDKASIRGERDLGIVLAFTVNELPAGTRDRLLARLVRAAQRGATVLVVEPISRRITPWWAEWAQALGGDAIVDRQWSLDVDFPEWLERLDRAAGLSHHPLKARTLLAGRFASAMRRLEGGP